MGTSKATDSKLGRVTQNSGTTCNPDGVPCPCSKGISNLCKGNPIRSEYEKYVMTPPKNSLPEDDASRGEYPMADGLLDYFPNALAYIAKVSKAGSDKHNKGQPMHWARGKSTDHRNKILRHLVDAGGKSSDGIRHSGNLAWRALALLQEELEAQEGCPVSRGSR